MVLEVDASDDYGLSEFALHYSVVGSDEVEVDFLSRILQVPVANGYLETSKSRGFCRFFHQPTFNDMNTTDWGDFSITLQIVPTDQEFRKNLG